MAAASASLLMQSVSIGGQRLAAVADAGLGSGLGGRGESRDRLLAALGRLAGFELALGWRPMHKDCGPEIGGKITQPAHHLDATLALRRFPEVIDNPAGASSK